jgi:uncharacterized BrkB/YihY/UPF0761 family membrane protein
MSKKTKKMLRRADAVANEVQEKLISYLLAAFGLVAGLAWNEAIKAGIDAIYSSPEDSLMAKFMYAGILTLIIAIITTIFVLVTKKDETSLKKGE